MSPLVPSSTLSIGQFTHIPSGIFQFPLSSGKRTDSRRVEISTESMADVDEQLIEALVSYKDAVDNDALLPISFV